MHDIVTLEHALRMFFLSYARREGGSRLIFNSTFPICNYKKGRPVSRVLYLAVSIIYLLRGSLHGSSDLPPGIGRANLSASVHGLATREVYGYPDRPGYR